MRSNIQTRHSSKLTDTPTFICAYCRKDFPREQKVVSVIFGRWAPRVLTREELEFCSEQHASYEQMSREG